MIGVDFFHTSKSIYRAGPLYLVVSHYQCSVIRTEGDEVKDFVPSLFPTNKDIQKETYILVGQPNAIEKTNQQIND